jgi:putative transposase
MSTYRRANIPGSTVFLTIVTHRRKPLFLDPENIRKLKQACVTVMKEKPFSINAAVILPEHLHFLWSLPTGDSNYSYRVGRMKVLFTRALRGSNTLPTNVSTSRKKHGLVKCVHQWQYSSFHRAVKRGEYRNDWGCQCDGANLSPDIVNLMNLDLGE